ncbi:helix-turn-helix domain-containing protein [Allorhizobium pseudoryzae]|uniref:helix-turn-helix domain-containing protein n=1 Tax=Allorhizobium pseudoryzae TaxID=379684 RepID=UPI003D060D72
MGEISTINYFAAIPGRANRDDRLSGLHFRVLGTIAGHDRMGRNGQCCWAGRNKLADLVGCHPSRLSTAISDLIEWGYLEEQRHESDGRKKGYRVVYEAAADAAGIGSKPKGDRLQDSNLSEAERLPDRNQSAGNRLRKRDNSDDQNTKNVQVNHGFDDLRPKLNILGRNQDITQKQGFGGGGKGSGSAQHLTNKLVEALGGGSQTVGWELYGGLPEEDRSWLERRLWQGALTAEDVHQARLTARKAVA